MYNEKRATTERATTLTFNESMEYIASLLIDKYDKTLGVTRSSTLEYLDTTLDEKTIPKERSPREVIEHVKNHEPEAIDELLLLSQPASKYPTGERPINMFYGDFCTYLSNVHGVTEKDFKEYYGEYEANCAQYAMFMATFLSETLPEISPALVFGHAEVFRRGIKDEKRSFHFWVELDDGTILDNSGVHNEIYTGFISLAVCSSLDREHPDWVLDTGASSEGGWLYEYVLSKSVDSNDETCL